MSVQLLFLYVIWVGSIWQVRTGAGLLDFSRTVGRHPSAVRLQH